MRTYRKEELQEIVFPLEGIGTGGLGLSGTGALVDWELDGRANKHSINGFSHFAIKAERDGKVVDARVLMGDQTRALSGDTGMAGHFSWGYGNGIERATMAGMPHFADMDFTGGFPFARIDYRDDRMPADITLTAFNPFIPGDEDDSSLPAAFFSWQIKNTSDARTDYTLALSVSNTFTMKEGSRNRFEARDGFSAITLSTDKYTPDDAEYGELMASTDAGDVSYQEYWFRSAWFDELTVFWREFTAAGKLKNRFYPDNKEVRVSSRDMATLAAHVTLEPGEAGEIRFVTAWYYPNFVKYWDDAKPMWKHEYCRRFSSAAEVAGYCYRKYDGLYSKSKAFQDAMFDTTIPELCAEAAAFNLEVLKSPTCLRLENGEFWAFEGTRARDGSCEGTCDHVWGYQYALAFLFPRLARQILETSYDHSMKDSGEMMFRTMLPLGSKKWDFRACVDGQMGSVIRFYREWKLSGDDEWLRRYWPKVKKSLEYAWSSENRDLWDPGKTGVITGRQHHTLDVELFGPCSWLTGYYLAALKAASEIAAYLGETDKADEYARMFESGSKYADRELFNGRHYIQKIDVKDRSMLDPYSEKDPDVYRYWNDEKQEIKYQFAEGCEIDQLIGQWHASLVGLGGIFDAGQRKQAAKAIYDINFKSMRDVANPCRVFALNDEKGAVICEWAKDKYRPQIPIPYTEECMTGFEYAAAQLMMQEGMIDEGVELVEAIRDRYDGVKRNPYAEIECGSSYARSMASFSIPAVLSGFMFDMSAGMIGFMPRLCGRFKSVWFVADAWGTFEKTESVTEIKVLGGSLKVNTVKLPYLDGVSAVICDGKEIPFRFDKDTGCVLADCTATQSVRIAGEHRVCPQTHT
ncbi:MAG: hypothetical protein IKS78_01105 [Clostridia bacterium]|nr:hypothetical protein [Clostridia bacterium]